MDIFTKIKKELKRKVTVMLIHHGKLKPMRLSISLFLLCIIVVSWTSVTLWAGYLASRHIDYLKAKADNHVMQFRMLFFANQLEKTKNMFEKVQINDNNIRSLLSLRTKKSIIEDNFTDQFLGEGGPTEAQANAFLAVLSGKINNINYIALAKQSDMLNEQYKYMQKSYSEVILHIKQERLLFMATPRGWPAEGVLTSRFGFRQNPFFNTRDFHSGLDIANALNTNVVATANGKVVFSGWQSGYGNIIVVDHGYNYRTAYAHLSNRLVLVGDYIARGQIIGKMGNTGSATGPHVHYEVHFKGKSINPISFLSDYSFGGKNVEKEF
ncbi:MAG: M23 family metallopeptidase [Endomicrobium sp.]|jgi:murein DD-endopeptidase MepM/ murein hydrolase activator NlpD|nr:M23 family metallopeptidase [Endomicrobium sp.]